MAYNVFGIPITDETLKALPQYYDKQISKKDRAYVAMDMKNAEGKDADARKFAEALKKEFDQNNATMCLIYNATGDPVTYVRDYEEYGHLSSCPYPVVISNGQWGVFIHGKSGTKNDYTLGCVVYSGKNNGGDYRHWLISWRNNNGPANTVYTDIREPHYYDKDSTFQSVREIVSRSPKVCQANENGGLLIGSIGASAVTFLEAIMTLPETIGLE